MSWGHFKTIYLLVRMAFLKNFTKHSLTWLAYTCLTHTMKLSTKGMPQLSISQRRGVICLIPKDDSCSIELTNWRPLTLLNVDCKIEELRKYSPCWFTLIKRASWREDLLDKMFDSWMTLWTDIPNPRNSQVFFSLLIFARHLTPLNGILFISVSNYTTSAQILGDGYPFFTTMLKAALWMQVLWQTTKCPEEVAKGVLWALFYFY